MKPTRPRLALALALPLVWLASFAALAPVARADEAAASTLYDEGKTLFAAGRYSEASEKLEASYQLSPLSGTAGLLAACHERTGRLASAWARYREAAVLAERSGNPERATIARAKADELEPRLARLRIDASTAPGEHPPIVTRNGEPVPDAALGTAVPVDAGSHVVVAIAPGHRRWTATVDVRDGERRIVSIPPLAAIALNLLTPPPARSSTRAWVGLIAAGVGGAAALTGGGFAIAAARSWSQARDRGCTDDGVCPDRGSRALVSRAGTRADVATGLVAGGLAVATAGLILYWTAPDRRAEERSPAVSASIAGDHVALLLEGRF
jgi:hypothetical protein